MSVNEKMTAIADNIRDKTGGTEPLTLDDIASGVNEVYEAGKEKECSDFWDSFQQNGRRTNYNYGFGGEGWTMATFKPKYDIVAISGTNMFYLSSITDLETALNNAGVKLDTSNMSLFTNSFYFTSLTIIPELDCRGTEETENPFSTTFYLSSNLVTIRKIILPTNGKQKFASTFGQCTKLQNITFEGVIGQDISFSSSPLTAESMKNIVKHLKNYAGTDEEYKHTLTVQEESYLALAGSSFTREDIEWLEENGIVHPFDDDDKNEDGTYSDEEFWWFGVLDWFGWNWVTVS